MSSRRPRRSRIYDSNYNMSENYYKSAIDQLDAKYRPVSSGLQNPVIYLRNSEPPRVVSPIGLRMGEPRSSFLDSDIEADLEFSRDRASRAIQKETVLDRAAGRKGLSFDIDSGFDGQVQKTLDRINESKNLLKNIDFDDSTDATSSKFYKKRSVKMVSDVASSKASTDLTKWQKSTDYNDSESYAAARARQSAARIQDIENDMYERSERQNAREQRSANLKKLLAEGDFDADSLLSNGVSSLKITKSTRNELSTY